MKNYPSIQIEESDWGPQLRIASPDSDSLLEVCDDWNAPIPFSCRAASCSNCRIQVLSGEELLESPNEMEQELLTALEQPEKVRFACCAQLRAYTQASATLVIRPLGAIEEH